MAKELIRDLKKVVNKAVFESGGYPVDEEVIKEFIRQSIADYVAEF